MAQGHHEKMYDKAQEERKIQNIKKSEVKCSFYK